MDSLSLLSCRMCLEIPSEESLTFSITDTFKGRNLSNLIEQLFNIKISKEDYLTNICISCINHINTVHKIYQKFVQSNAKLKELLQNFNDISEEVEVLVIDDVNLLNETISQGGYEEDQEQHISSENGISLTNITEDIRSVEKEAQIKIEFLNSPENLQSERTKTLSSISFDQRCELNVQMKNTIPQIPKHKCYFCQTVFATELAFTEHQHLHFKEVPLVCEKCNNLVIKSVRQASKHLALHDEDERPYKCRICELRFFTRENSLTHERKIHRMKVKKQQQQARGFAENKKLKEIQCKKCGFSVLNVHHLKKHELIHGLQPVHTCQVCNKQFTAKKNLTRHLMIHTGELPYKCDLCDRAFRQAGDLKDHKRSHTKEKPYMCNECGVRFRNISMLHVHRKKLHATIV